MPWNLHGTHVQEGDLVQLVGLRHKHFIVRLKAGEVFHSHRGVLKHDDLIGLPWGTQVFSHNGAPFFVIQPALGDLLRGIKRNTQILYPKDIGYILVTMGIGPGMHVLEAGTGSGALTSAFAYAVGPQGHVTSYEARPEMQAMALRNLQHLGLEDRVTLKLGNVSDGFAERNVDALFYDLPNPYDYAAQAREALKPGGFFGSILPTVNQVSQLLVALRRERFAFIDVLELMLRFFKPEPSRMRPADRMIAHTGYLIFARPVLIDMAIANRALLKETGFLSEIEEKEASVPVEDGETVEIVVDEAALDASSGEEAYPEADDEVDPATGAEDLPDEAFIEEKEDDV